VHTVNTARWRDALFSTQTWERVAAALSEVRAQHYGAAIDFQGAIRSSLIARWSGAPVILGFAQPRENAASMFYTRKVEAEGAHVVEQNYRLAREVAPDLVPVSAIPVPEDPAADRAISSWLWQRRMRDFAILNPGAGWGAKQWPAERYAEVAARLGECNMRSVVNGSPREGALLERVAHGSQGAAEPLSCSIAELISLTRRAKLFIGGDTGPLHLAAALGTPAVAIFGPTSPTRNGPYTGNAIVLRDAASVTSHKRVESAEPGLLNISVPQVLRGARTIWMRNYRAAEGAHR
jgi:heptosyltransferase-1